ncbi:MAG: SBBP repeat-containing protein, partial [Minwuiales bacterium]|nr:SBBP repeat-containing protein [Minwuiales bacterium]
GLNIISGKKEESIKAEAISPKTRATFTGDAKFGSGDEVIADIDPNAQFDIRITKADATVIDVNIDLSALGGADRNLINIVNHVNNQLDAAGVITRFAVGRNEDGGFRIDVDRSLSEQVEFSAPVSESAVYLAATSGSGDNAAGLLRKLDDLGNVAPNIADTNRIQAEGGGTTANAVAVDSQGNTYVVGKTSADLDGQINQSTDDLFLTKYDAAGNVLFSRLLGAEAETSGLAITVDSNDNVIVAGQTRSELEQNVAGLGLDSFVTKFDSTGQEVFTRQIRSSSGDGALAVTVDESDNIFFAGFAAGGIAGQTNGGGNDAYLVKLDANGTQLGAQQFGGAGDQRATALAFHGGQVYVAGNDGNQAFVRRFDAATLTEDAGFQVDLGAGGAATQATALTVDATGQVFLGGHTTDAGLPNSAGGGRIAHQGGTDGFVSRLNGTTGAVEFTSYVGTGATDKVTGIAVDGTDIYVSGTTGGGLFGENLGGSKDAFVAKLDDQGAAVFNHQFTGAGGVAAAGGIQVAAGGTSVLTRLGLPHGDIPKSVSTSVTSNSSVRPGDSFFISVNDGLKKRVTIEAGDSFRKLAFSINQALKGQGFAKVVYDSSDGEKLEIKAANGNAITIHAGPDGANALAGLGLRETTLFPDAGSDSDDEGVSADSIFALGFIGQFDLTDQEEADLTAKHMDSAILKIQDAYKQLIGDIKDPKELERNLALATPPPPYLAAKIANYQEALLRLGGTL